MRKLLSIGLATVLIGGATVGTLIARAQPAPPPAQVDAPPPPHPGWMGWMHRMRHDGQGGPGWGGPRTFALIYRPDDRALTAPDVQKIAEAFLLWNGNRTWKVTDVADGPDNTVGFAFATQDGSVIARFSMDRKTGRVQRAG
jgi:hypothetical protein